MGREGLSVPVNTLHKSILFLDSYKIWDIRLQVFSNFQKDDPQVQDSKMKEFDQIRSMVSGFSRCPDQLNEVFRSDAEILRVGNTTMAISVDTMVDEIDLGIYTDPGEIGYIAVMSTVADMVACGSNLIGVLVSLELPRTMTQEDVGLLHQGIRKGCEVARTYLLGGDTNWSDRIRVGVVGVGVFETTGPVMRTGIQAGDLLFVSGKLGGGNANAINSLLLSGRHPERILPRSICDWEKLHATYSSAGTDTSDGFFTALYNLGKVNDVNFELTVPIPDILEPAAATIAADAGVPLPFLLAGPVGEYELVFTVPRSQKSDLLAAAHKLGLDVIQCGVAMRRADSGIKLKLHQRELPLDALIEAQQEAASDIGKVMDNLFKYDLF